MTQHEEEQQRQHKFEQKIRIIGGIISVLGVAASTVMSIMQIEKQARGRMKKVKGRTVKTKQPKLLKGQAAKKKHARSSSMAKLSRIDVRQLKKDADEALKQAEALKAEIIKENGEQNGKLSTQTEE